MSTEVKPAAAPPTVPLTGLRGAVARAMVAAWQFPRVAVKVDVDFEACLARREARQAQLGDSPRLSPTHFILRAVALALRDHPRLNGWVDDAGVETVDSIDVGLAVSVEEGILVPVLRRVDEKSVEEIAAESAELAAQARANKLAPSAMRGATFTVSTLGSTGADWFTPILNPPQIAILGVGAVKRRPVVRGERIVAASVGSLTLVFDHRATDGQPGATFLSAVRDELENPGRICPGAGA